MRPLLLLCLAFLPLTASAQPSPRMLRDQVIQERYRAEGREREAARAAEDNAAREQRLAAAEQERIRSKQQKALEVCQNNASGALYRAQEQVIASREMIDEWRHAQAQERRISAAAGVRNLSRERFVGESLVESQDTLSMMFSEYRGFGGRAKTASAVTHLLPDPCS
jgi:hypothetical protein